MNTRNLQKVARMENGCLGEKSGRPGEKLAFCLLFCRSGRGDTNRTIFCVPPNLLVLCEVGQVNQIAFVTIIYWHLQVSFWTFSDPWVYFKFHK